MAKLKPIAIIWLLLLNLALAACSNNNTPEGGPSIAPRTDNINISGGNATSLTLDIPAGELNLNGSNNAATLVSGTIEYNSEALKPVTEESGTNGYKLSQLPKGQKLPLPLINKWNITLGKASPLDLNLQLGNSNSSFTVGDLKLAKLKAKGENGNLTVNFNQAQDSLTEIDLATNNGALTLNGLTNAAPEVFNAKVGSGSINLDLASGTLRRSLSGTAGIGNGNINLTLPAGVGAKIECTVTTGNCKAPGFTRVANSNFYQNADYAKGGNTILLKIGISNGSLEVIIK